MIFLTFFNNLIFFIMKNNFKLMVAIFGMTIATLGSIDAKARVAPSNVRCYGPGSCGYTPNCDVIYGAPVTF